MRKKKSSARSSGPKTYEGCYHPTHVGQVSWDIQKYFEQRYSLFSKYDEGIWLTEDAWFGVTPEPVANKIAEHLSIGIPETRTVLVDAFAGIGGNTIAFAKSGRWSHIYGIEKDPCALACAKHNAEIYGVTELITWVEGDCFELLKGNLSDLGGRAVLFGSPPWGGPGYRSDEIFNLFNMQPYGLNTLIEAFRSFSPYFALYVPRTSDIRQLASYGDHEIKAVAIHYCMEGASKAICAYYGGLKNVRANETY